MWLPFVLLLLFEFPRGQSLPYPSSSETKLEASKTNETSSFKFAVTKAREKCHEYSQYRYKAVQTPGSKKIWLPDCYSVEELIPNSKLAEPKEFPHMALIGYKKDATSTEWLCSGSLISEKFILSFGGRGDTKKNGKNLMAYFRNPQHGVQSNVKQWLNLKIKQRHDYSKDNGIVLFELESSVQFSVFVRPICLPNSPPTTSELNEVITSGWNLKNHSQSSDQTLYKTIVNFVDKEKCDINEVGHPTAADLETKILIEELNANTSDIGSPLQAQFSGEFCLWELIGVVQSYRTCNSNRLVTVVDSVYKYSEWIQQRVWPSTQYMSK